MDKNYQNEVFYEELFRLFSYEMIKSSYDEKLIDNSSPSQRGMRCFEFM